MNRNDNELKMNNSPNAISTERHGAICLSLTIACIDVNPFYEFFQLDVTKFSNNTPLVLEICYALNTHQGHDDPKSSKLTSLATNPPKKLKQSHEKHKFKSHVTWPKIFHIMFARVSSNINTLHRNASTT